MAYNTLDNYYKTIFALTYHHKWPTNIEEMIPYERDIYVAMIHNHLEQLREERIQEQNRRNALERKGY